MVLTRETTVGELAAGNPAAVRVFEKYQIDYCCGGGRPLEQVCREKGYAVADILTEIEQSVQPPDAADWNARSLAELIDHIISRHHGYLKSELPALSAALEKVIAAHGAAQGESLFPLREVFGALRSELGSHMMKEEMILFPLVKRMESGDLSMAHCGSVANPIRVMLFEHDSAAAALQEIRKITGDFTLPAGACNTYRALFDRFKELEADLHVHIHLENNILFPRAMRLEAGGAGVD